MDGIKPHCSSVSLSLWAVHVKLDSQGEDLSLLYEIRGLHNSLRIDIVHSSELVIWSLPAPVVELFC